MMIKSETKNRQNQPKQVELLKTPESTALQVPTDWQVLRLMLIVPIRIKMRLHKSMTTVMHKLRILTILAGKTKNLSSMAQ